MSTAEPEGSSPTPSYALTAPKVGAPLAPVPGHFGRLSEVAASSVMVLGAVVLLGWVIDSEPLQRLHASYVTMKANTALSFLLLGGGLWCLRLGQRYQAVQRALGSAVLLVAAATLLEYAFDLEFGIDQALFRDARNLGMAPGRMAPVTAGNFLLLGSALVFWRRDGSAPLLVRIAVVASAIAAFVALAGYVFGASSLYRIKPYSSIALHTALGFLAACAAFFTAKPAFHVVSVIAGDTAAGVILRRVLPAAVLVPMVLGWLKLLGERHGLYDASFGAAIVTVGDALLLGTVVLAVADRLHRAEQQVRAHQGKREQAEKQFRLAIEASPTGMLVVDRSGKIVLANAEVERLFGYSRDALAEQSIDMLVPTRLRRHHARLRDGFFERPSVRSMAAGLELYGERRDGTEVPIEIALNPLESGTELMLATVVDITGRKRAAREHEELMAQRRATELLRERSRFFELSIDMVCVANAAGFFEQLNPAFAEVLGFSREELLEKPFLEFVHPEDREATLNEMRNLEAGTLTLDFTNRYQCKDGRYRWLQWRAAPEHDGTIYAVARDVTRDRELLSELRTKQASLSESLKERELLLQEIHHRVKNNLQIISSLINLQARQFEDAGVRSALAECKARVEAIASIHEELYQAKDFANVPFSRYAASLARNVFLANGTPCSGVSLEVDVEDIALPVDRAIPCGLILNELITNALKHAFPNGRRGVLRVAMRMANDDVVLTVADDGIGMRPNFEPERADSLGLQLVTTLSDQLEGRVAIEGGDGTTFRVTFPRKGRA